MRLSYVPARWSVYGRSVQRVRYGGIGLGLIGVFLAGESGTAQSSADSPVRLTVRPHEMATGTQNPAAGQHHLAASADPRDSLERYVVYVPPRCVGAHRCPLFVYLQPGTEAVSEILKSQQPVADKYGFLVLARDGGMWPDEKERPVTFAEAERKGNLTVTAEEFSARIAQLEQAGQLNGYRYPFESARRHLDAALKQILKTFAVDPGKVAISGHCASGHAAIFLGGANQDVFSRIILKDPSYVDASFIQANMPPATPTQAIEFHLEGATYAARDLLWRLGYRVKSVWPLRGHSHQVEDDDITGRWLQDSWIHDSATRTQPRVIDPLPLLTIEALTQLRTFWDGFKDGCGGDDHCGVITREQRIPLLREIVLPVAGFSRTTLSTVMMDMPAAAQHPAVAALLKKAGLTAQQHDAYRLALLSGEFTQLYLDHYNEQADEYKLAGVTPPLPPRSIDPASVQGKNMAFIEVHQDELDEDWARQMGGTP